MSAHQSNVYVIFKNLNYPGIKKVHFCQLPNVDTSPHLGSIYLELGDNVVAGNKIYGFFEAYRLSFESELEVQPFRTIDNLSLGSSVLT